MLPSPSSTVSRRLLAAVSGAVAVGMLSMSTTTPVASAQEPTPPPAQHPTQRLTPEAVPLASAVPATSGSAPLRVASFNIRCATCYEGRPNEKPWADRRGVVVDEIKGQDLDVLAVQEASQGQLHDAASADKHISQFDDLVQRLGGSWALTNATRYNCVKDTSPNGCTYAYKGASEGQRILYDASRVDLVAQGSKLLPVPKGKGDNYMTWAQFRQVSTGKRFMVSDLHVVGTDKDYTVKRKEAQVALAELKANNPDGLPMIAMGDWNSSRFEKPSNAPYDVYVHAGFVDPLGGAYKTHKPTHATVEHKIHTWLNSSNPSWSRTAPGHKSWGLGSYIDYILTTKMRVSEWETVAHLSKKGKFVGTIPSDHNMVRATVELP